MKRSYSALPFALLIAAATATAAPEFEVAQTDAPPVVDGRLDDKLYAQAAAAKSLCTGFFTANYAGPAEYQPVIYLAYDQEFLYVGANLPYPAGHQLLRRSTGGGERFSWYDDLIQIFVGPEKKESPAFFAISASGSVDREEVSGAATVSGSRWCGEMAIPWRLTGVQSPRPGTKITFKLFGYQSWANSWIMYVPPQYGNFTHRTITLTLGELPHVPFRPRTPAEDDF